MFTGLVEALGEVAWTREEPPGRRLALRLPPPLAGAVAVGDSVALNGCCLTAVAAAGDSSAGLAEFEAGPETLLKTNLGRLAAGDPVNLERALAASARLGGHLVQGHIDGVGHLASRRPDGPWEIVRFGLAPELARLLVPKGSVAVDGVSLTVVDADAESFSVMLIPHTLAVTTLGRRQPGDPVNLETDILGKYVLRFAEPYFAALARRGGGAGL